MLTVKQISEKRASILEVVEQAKEDLAILDTEIDAAVSANKEAIASLIAENSALAGLKTSNAATRKSLLSILGK